MAAASIAVTASGGSVWECAYLNTPAVAVPVAENQVAIAKKGEELGFAVVLQPDSPDFSTFLAKEVVELVKNDSKRSAMSRQSTGLIDGMGSKRVVRKILEKVTS
jgi:spore coat polysaccharide biosynthesis predicted glycosyltransferase SpsG